ncbi:MAG: nucleotidyltransferase domain-containing protein [Phycisphaerales bacterium]|nr:MAG: nucleotidyltransferase domain-containing protein [Phycisphaerales bacterium]
MDQVEALSRQIAREFEPERIILFGSYARGNPHADSDVDLLVLLRFQGKPFRKSLEILNRTNPPFAVDVVVRNTDDAARRYAEFDPLIRDAFDHGIVLYERNG